MLMIISGSSGVGKNTIINDLLKTDKFQFLPTVTTRSMRVGESQGNPYFFVTKEQFEQKIANGELLEWEKLHNENYYGTPNNILKSAMNDGKILIKDIDVFGTKNLKKLLKEKNIPCVSVFLTVDKETLRKRLQERGEKDIDIRLSRYELEEKHSKEYDYIIYNDDKQKTIDKILSIAKVIL